MVLGLIPVCVEITCSPHVSVSFLWVLQFLLRDGLHADNEFHYFVQFNVIKILPLLLALMENWVLQHASARTQLNVKEKSIKLHLASAVILTTHSILHTVWFTYTLYGATKTLYQINHHCRKHCVAGLHSELHHHAAAIVSRITVISSVGLLEGPTAQGLTVVTCSWGVFSVCAQYQLFQRFPPMFTVFCIW